MIGDTEDELLHHEFLVSVIRESCLFVVIRHVYVFVYVCVGMRRCVCDKAS